MRKLLALGLAVVFLGSCGVTPQLTVKSRRYQKGLFVQVNWNKHKTQTIKYSKSDHSIEQLPSYKIRSILADWWKMHDEGTAALPEFNNPRPSTLTTPDKSTNTIKINSSKQMPEFLKTHDRKVIKKNKLVKSIIKPAPSGDETLSLLSLIMGAGGFMFLFLSFFIPFIGWLSLLAFTAGVVLGILALSKEGSNAKAIIGLVLSSLGCLLWLIFGLLVGAAFAAFLALA